jgi:hypothetical protein
MNRVKKKKKKKREIRKLSNTKLEAAHLTTRCVEISTSKRLQKS